MHGLNPHQAEAVAHVGGPLLVIAGAGSGKTRVITRKIAHLIRAHGVPARNIVALTFTNKAAREMKARVGTLLKGQNARGLRVSTFHTFGLNLLRREVEAAGLRPGFSLFDPEDAATVLKEHLREHDLADAVTPAAALARISRWKNALIDPARAAGTAEDDFDAMLADLYGRYEQSLAAYNACDFDDLIARPVRLLRDDRELRERWQNRIRHLLVDEYQDTNGAQYELVRLLVGPRGAFTVVGDDDQSIYAWRGARPDNLARLRDHYPTLRVVMLEQNYRSSGRILKLANGLIGHNPHLFDKRLWCDLGPGEPARVLVCRDEAHEAERVAAEIQHMHLTKDRPYGSIAILYRSNHQARPFEQALRALSVPYFLSGGTSFFARAEVKDVMAYLRLLANPADDAAFLRVVNVPRREIGPTTLQRLAAFAAEGDEPLAAVCADPRLAAQMPARQAQRLMALAGSLAEHRAQSERAAHPIAAVRALLEHIDYAGWCRDNAPSRAAAERRMDNVTDLLNWLERLHREAAAEGPPPGLPELVAKLTLLDVLERQDEAEGGERVHLMTLHAAKGLEFPHVYLVGMEEELLPHRGSLDAADAGPSDSDTGAAGGAGVEEERRLCYVGITRAQQSLTFTRARRRRRYGETVTCAPSRFLSELPSAELHQPDSTKRTDAEARAHGSAQLAALKGLLADR
ncbi:UvrD-helicase domain-containing protein [uncultured Thiohalocapsa sp.]|uniref:UvrD-helicase domain-containing protein n=1 Tax=uncultured Thiohalocapsa sp. TaxID=768990 RepID=UPI0025EFB69E|nr:UvrD-helicase domain-containing protein [uncultured Thiohalocapsa sp.]